MRSLHAKRRLASVLIPVLSFALSGAAWAANTKAADKVTATAKPSGNNSSNKQFVDGIAAVVNKNVITLRQVENELQAATAQLQQQKIPLPDHATLQKQVLQRLIADELENQEATRLGIDVSDAQLEQALQSIADRNKISRATLRTEIERTGLSWDAYVKTLRQEMRTDQLRQRMVDSTIVISDADVDAFLRNQGQTVSTPQPVAQAQPQPQPQQQAPVQQAGPKVLGLAQVLVAVPEGASSSKVQELRQKAEAILAQVRGGADFAGVAAASSDAPEALSGGELGVRPAQGWPDLFLEATKNLQAGQVSAIVQSGNGFHILKVLTRGPTQQAPARQAAAPAPMPVPASEPAQMQDQGPMMVTQTHARHILIKTSKVVSDAQAKTRLEQLRQRLQNGEKFEDLAKRNSDDASAPQGGDLGWLTPGETVPPFEQAMNALGPDQISEPVQSQFGWHLIQVLERRTKNMENEFRRMQARQILFQRRVEPALEDWLSQLRGEAYIDNRLDPEKSRNRR